MSDETQRFANLIREHTGNALPASRLPSLEQLLERRAAATSRSHQRYLNDLAAGRLSGEWSLVVTEITIKESFFFRAPQQFEAIARQVLPQLVAARAATRRLRVWSVASASGEEPATLAILLAEQASLHGWDWQVLATDLDADALERARRGLHGERAVAGVPEAMRERWFSRRAGSYELSPQLQERIVYRELNLVRPPWTLPERAFDLILARNVLIYFRRTMQRRVLASLAEYMAADGFLFLGASETLWQAQGELDVQDLGGVFCYRFPKTPKPTAAAKAPSLVPQPSLSASKARRGATAKAPGAALAKLAAPPVVSPPATPLLVAVEALRERQFEPAGRAIERALAEDPEDARAHAVCGLLSEVLGNGAAAVAAYRAALYLDPGLYQVRALLAEALARQGETERADQQWRELLRELASGRAHAMAGVDGLPWPERERSLRRARQALREPP
ncbi:MAG: CheR family methyltransferase [Acidobacteriota bacterium]